MSKEVLITKRDFLKGLAAGAVAALLDKTERQVQAESSEAKESLKPGDIAPETWGGTGLLDALIVYVRDTDKERGFTGQVAFLHRRGPAPDNSFTYTIVSGKDAQGKIIKGARFIQGRHSWSNPDELGIALGGGGGLASLQYHKDTQDLLLDMNGFIIYPDDESPGQRITLYANAKVDPQRSRVLHQPFPSSVVQDYMREGYETFNNSQTSALMVAHVSLRSLPVGIKPEELDTTTPAPSVVFGANNSLAVIQPDSNYLQNRKMASFVFSGGQDMDAMTKTHTEVDTDEKTGMIFPVLKRAEIESSFRRIDFDTNVNPTSDYAIKIGIPTPKGRQNLWVSLPTLPANGSSTELVMTQTFGVEKGSEIQVPSSIINLLQKLDQTIK